MSTLLTFLFNNILKLLMDIEVVLSFTLNSLDYWDWKFYMTNFVKDGSI